MTLPNSVSSLGDGVFSGCMSLTNVNLSGSMTTLPDNTFSGCTELRGVTIPGSVTNIGAFAFFGCTNVNSMNIPSSVSNMGGSAFQECTGLTNITMPSVAMIGDWTFFDCVSLQSPVLGNGLVSIGNGVFSYCVSFTNIDIPGSVTNIGFSAFGYCSNLTAFRVDARNPSYCSAGGALLDKIRSTLIQYPQGKAGDYTLPDGVATIGQQSFSGNIYLTKVTIPSSLAVFWSGAFSGCVNLTGLYFLGNAPTVLGYDTNWTYGTVYYLPGTTGWGPTFGPSQPGYNNQFHTAIWQLPYPVILTTGSRLGVQANQFGFTVSWATNSAVVVEASANLANPSWVNVSTNTLQGGTCLFVDPDWTNYLSRSYRVRKEAN